MIRYRKDLEDAYERILARTGGTAQPTLADADAALSIDIPDHRTINGALDYFSTDLHDSIQASLYRAARYRKMIDRVLDQEHLPRGLAYLPVIESAYMPTLTSRAGARGIWQLMPDTARELGLRVDWWVDERCDPEQSTRAAAVYLRRLYDSFGDWPLVLAAYNAGPGRIQRALDQTGSSTFWQLLDQAAIPKETRGYVPTFFATLLIVSDPSARGFELIDDAPDLRRPVTVEGPVTLGYVASVAGSDPRDLEEMNPALRHGIVPPGKQTIFVPPSAVPAVAQQASTLHNDDPNLPVATFTLRRHDSLASLARRLKVSPQEIVAMNGGSAAPGQSIYLPVTQRRLSELLSGPPAETLYTVTSGDTLYSIARRHGLKVEELMDLNQLGGSTTIHPGDRLRVTTGQTLTAGAR